MELQSINVLNKNNLLIQSNYSLNAIQNKYYLTILYNMQKESNLEYRCDIHLDTFKNLSKNKTHKNVNGIKEVLHNLMEKRIELRKLKPDKKGHIYFTRNIINGFNHDENTNIFTVVLDAEIYDLLIDYYNNGKGYTPLNLAVLLGLNNYYAQRIYELLRMESWKNKIININLDTLKESFELSSNYQEYKNFKRRVLIPGLDALNETGKIKIEYKEIKTGRKVTSIDFLVEDLEPREYFNTQQNNKEVAIIVETMIPDVQKVEMEQVVEIPINKKEVYNTFDILDLEIFKTGSLRKFKKEFKHIDFTSEYMQEAYEDAITIALDKDNVENIDNNNYKYFKGALENKILAYQEKEKLDLVHKAEMDMYWN